MCGATTIQDELKEPERALRQAIPDVYRGYGQLRSAAFRAGALDAATKELIALAIAVSRGCEGCIAAHARGAARRRATEDQVTEAMGVAIAMTGGPGLTYAPQALAAYREFAAARSVRAQAPATDDAPETKSRG